MILITIVIITFGKLSFLFFLSSANNNNSDGNVLLPTRVGDDVANQVQDNIIQGLGIDAGATFCDFLGVVIEHLWILSIVGMG